MKTMIIGIMPPKETRRYVKRIMDGSYTPKPNEPKVWFASIKSLAQMLSDENQALLKIIHETNPESISELAKNTGRQVSNLSRTLKALTNCGVVKLEKHNKKVKPIALATNFQVTFGVDYDQAA